jgi:PAS domain S-box-containing protein
MNTATESRLKKKTDTLSKKINILEEMIENKSRDLFLRNSQLESLNDYLDGIFDSMLDMVFIIDFNGMIKKTNRSAREGLGYSEGVLIDKNLSDLFDDKSVFKDLLSQSDSKEHEVKKSEILKKNGASIPVICTLSKMAGKKSDNDIQEEYVIVVKNISDLVEAEEKLEEQRLKAVEASRLASLGEMAGGIAHEINNPLAIIKASVAVLRKMLTKDSINKIALAKSFDQIDKTVSRISRIIKGLRVISRDSSETQLNQTNLREIIEDVLGICSEKFKSFGIDLLADLETFEHEVYCDRVQISQVLVNLLGNSYDAIENSDEKWIKVQFREDDKYFFMDVIDSGPGIPAEIQNKIFNPFYTSKKVGKGTGLGLSISKGILEDHGGDLILSQESPNTCFTLSLPKLNEDSNE